MDFLESDPGWTDPDDALREILEREHLIREMQTHPGWALWADFLAAEASGYQGRLLRGRHEDMLGYRYDAGVVEGLRIALGVADTLRTRASALRDNLRELGIGETPESVPSNSRGEG